MEYYNEGPKYQDKLGECMTGAHLICLDEVIHTVTKRGFKAIVLVLTKLRKSLVF